MNFTGYYKNNKSGVEYFQYNANGKDYFIKLTNKQKIVLFKKQANQDYDVLPKKEWKWLDIYDKEIEIKKIFKIQNEKLPYKFIDAHLEAKEFEKVMKQESSLLRAKEIGRRNRY